jgi:uncharacterized membrane protein
VHKHFHTGAGPSPSDREGGSDTATPSSGAARRRLEGPGRKRFRIARPKLGIRALKPVTYSIMHLSVAIAVAYALTRDWRIALGVGVIEPMVQTVAYMLHEKAWGAGSKRAPSPTPRAQIPDPTGFENNLSPTPRT